MTYTLFCAIIGAKAPPFRVDIDGAKTVDALKDAIKAKAAQTLASIDAHIMTLYKVNIDVSKDDLYYKAMQQIHQSSIEVGEMMVPLYVVSRYWEKSEPNSTIHILVKLPPAMPKTPRNKHPRLIPYTPLLNQEGNRDITERVTVFATDLESIFERYLKENVQLPLWQPPSHLDLSDKIRSHITDLKIPIINSSSQNPLLLLHNLGRRSHDARLAERVDGLFRSSSMTKFLCNTSGSGKTRLLLEGLSHNWGFYFTARVEPERVGSSDLKEVLEDLQPRLKKITDGNSNTALIKNREDARRRFLLLLYARYVCFRVFLGCAAAMTGGITENHKLRWLLIQVAPVTLLEVPDIFLDCIKYAGRAPTQYLEDAIKLESGVIKEHLQQRSALFCVLDEAQDLIKVSVYFRSADSEVARPILREILHSWSSVLPNLIVSGTGISMRKVENVINSAVAKEGRQENETVTEIGGFDNEDGQQAYLKQYFPPGFLDTSEGKEVASRVGYWLRGRHRFIASYLSRLIRSGFKSPHGVLNDFVSGMTRFRPSGWYDGPTIELEPPRGFNFESLLDSERKTELLITLADFVFEYIFTGKIRGLSGPIGDAMVEYGVSRFKKQEAQTDEPLAVLGLVTFVERQELTLAGHLSRDLNTSSAAYRGVAFEPFGAYLLARAFSVPTRLSQVFKFVGGKKMKVLQNQLAELVTLEKVGDNFRITPLQITTNLRPSHILGRSPSTAAETLEWLQNPQGSAFCFPANTVGPDLIFVLRLTKDNTVLRVCVQFKHTQQLSPQQTEKAIRTTDPSTFLSHKTEDNNSPTCSKPSMQLKIKEAIKNLGNGTRKAGRYGVLGVVCSHPSFPDSNSLEEAAKGGHPLATVLLSHLEPDDSDLGQVLVSLAQLAQQTTEIPDRKRKGKNSDNIEGPRSKRKNSDNVEGPRSKRKKKI